jgi:hypothetical protein
LLLHWPTTTIPKMVPGRFVVEALTLLVGETFPKLPRRCFS